MIGHEGFLETRPEDYDVSWLISREELLVEFHTAV